MAPPIKKWTYGRLKPLTWFLDEGNGKRTALGQVYIPNKGTVAITSDGRAFTDSNGSWKPIHLTNYDKLHISKAIKPGGSGVYGGSLGAYGKATQSVVDAWNKNSKTWLATSRPSAKPSVALKIPKSPETPRTNLDTLSTDNAVSLVTDKNYLYGYKGKSTQPRINNSAEGRRVMAWLKRLGVKADGWWGKNTAAAYNGQTTDITNSHNVSTLINNASNSNASNSNTPKLGTLPVNLLENTPLSNYEELSEHSFNRADIRLAMRDNGLNPYSYSGSARKLLRAFLNDPKSENTYTQLVSNIVGDLKIRQNMLNNAVLNLMSLYQLTKPLLVSLKFKQGG